MCVLVVGKLESIGWTLAIVDPILGESAWQTHTRRELKVDDEGRAGFRLSVLASPSGCKD